jgi:hypothetical protein
LALVEVQLFDNDEVGMLMRALLETVIKWAIKWLITAGPPDITNQQTVVV